MTAPAAPPSMTPSAETVRLGALVDAIGAETADAARAYASLVRRRAEAMHIALGQVQRSRSRTARERELPVRSLALEIAVATRMHDLTVQKELSDAVTLTEKFAQTVTALEEGRIGPRHAHAILETGIVLDDDQTRAGWETVVLSRAESDSPGCVRAFGRELAESVHPEGMTVRHARAVESRGVSIRDLADGMAELSVILPATIAYGIRDRLRRQAEALRAAAPSRDDLATERERDAIGGAGPSRDAEAGDTLAALRVRDERATTPAAAGAGDAPSPAAAEPRRDTRTLAQIGADLCADLLLTAAPAIDPTTEATCPGGLGAIRGHVQITVPVLTLLGRSDVGASLDGRTPIDPETARRLAARAPGWDRVLCDPVTGTVLEVDRYSPTASQRRYLAARDRHCRAPGCRAPAARCQLDHTHEAQHGGRTRLTNLSHLCVRHHTLKTETDWTVTQDDDGTLHFRSPLGRRSSEKLPARVLFLPDAVSAPF